MSSELQITRRGMIKGAGAGAAGIVSAGLVPSAASAGVEVRPKPPFDIRDLVEDAELDPESIQCVYDDINRMIILIGGITFRRLFGAPVPDIVAEASPRIQVAAQYGLLDDPGRVAQLAAQLAQNAPGMTIGDFFSRRTSQVPQSARQLLIELRREGVKIPVPLNGQNRQRRRVIRKMRKKAGKLTLQTFFTTGHDEVSDQALEALGLARTHGLLLCDNCRQCDRGGGDPEGIRDRCVPANSGWCNLSFPKPDFCASGSTPLPGDRPRKRD